MAWPLVRLQLEAMFGVVMRVPGLFLIDYWWQYERKRAVPHSVNSKEILAAVLTNLVLLHGFLLLLLPLHQVQALYSHFVSALLLLSAHSISHYYLNLEHSYLHSSDTYFWPRQGLMLFYQLLMSVMATRLLSGPGKPYCVVLASYTLPVLARMIGLPLPVLEVFHHFCSGVIVLSLLRYAYLKVPFVLDCVKDSYLDVLLVTELNGWMALPTVLWNKLFVPTHFLLFWLSLFAIKLTTGFYAPRQLSVWGDAWYTVLLGAASAICVSPVSLVASAVTVSYLSYFVLLATKYFLNGGLGHNALLSSVYSGWTEGLTMVLFALQTGLIEMKMPARMAVMTIILFIDLSTLLQSMLEITEPAVLSLSASRSQNWWRHIRAFSVCTFLFVFPLYLTYSLAQVFPLDFWMMILLSSCILTSFQVLDLLFVHCLFFYDSSRKEPWEHLDDMVYYTRAVTKVLELGVAIFVVVVGLWESPNGKWNWANSSIILIHCYFNVWQRIQAGWKSFLLRRDAVLKTQALPSATIHQLKVRNDVCAICYADMDKACLTPCGHYFHRTCLRKWLYIQDTCPLCHTTIVVSTSHLQSNSSNSVL